MKYITFQVLLAVIGLSTNYAAVTFSTSVTAPTVNGADIAQLTSTDADWNTSVIWGDRPARGQTFTTGSDLGGYLLSAFTLQSNMAQSDDGTYVLRVGTISGTSFTQIWTDSVTTTVNVAANDYVTFTFESSLALAADTTYGIDVARPGSGWSSYRNTDNSSYAGGGSYDSGGSGVGGATITTHGTDRVFHLEMTAIPEPRAALLSGLGALLLLMRRRRCD